MSAFKCEIYPPKESGIIPIPLLDSSGRTIKAFTSTYSGNLITYFNRLDSIRMRPEHHVDLVIPQIDRNTFLNPYSFDNFARQYFQYLKAYISVLLEKDVADGDEFYQRVKDSLILSPNIAYRVHLNNSHGFLGLFHKGMVVMTRSTYNYGYDSDTTRRVVIMPSIPKTVLDAHSTLELTDILNGLEFETTISSPTFAKELRKYMADAGLATRGKITYIDQEEFVNKYSVWPIVSDANKYNEAEDKKEFLITSFLQKKRIEFGLGTPKEEPEASVRAPEVTLDEIRDALDISRDDAFRVVAASDWNGIFGLIDDEEEDGLKEEGEEDEVDRIYTYNDDE